MRLPTIEQSPDLLERHRLRHEQVYAARERLALIPAGSKARERDDEGWRVRGRVAVVGTVVMAAGFFDVADGAGGFEAVEDGHADV